MSLYGSHNSHMTEFLCYETEIFPFTESNTPTHTPSPKAYHAELLFKSWNECKVKQIYSHRQGISYTAWKKRNLAVESGDSSQDTPTSSSSNPITPTISLPAMEKNLPTVGSYGPYNFDIPTDLLPYVPPGHLYVNKKAKRSKIIPPGSPEWIDKIKVIQQEYETYYELLKIAEDQKAKFLGTSSKHLHKRKGLVSDLTKYTDTFDRKFTSLLNRRACCTKQKAIMQANEDFKTFQPDYFERVRSRSTNYQNNKI
ncbi:hypothetical protein GLOIN_2v1482640 [Rhizophagus irregularis DAOM 181602=DAOM 197198]|uniref:Uncharacterized protein n=1 Tax=Rhizophagus irregularis (strain DAOM 181602 / DAOM 197198 / MUCL 43194) TaxID=747089 RepID=A0A2P4PL53_RHIID|nr:hypothetical protein GLOIN_2v1482640 [Rhizophagus irregularis DAOM 181602=DAOM 197198]POG66100.1 hypothetical protein GLOIN_2v1482640 [Rhizophagus irregularis DAOM 181602=DAOM 197198]|eukprot:XP_025172966.1 hypothetical protein GLOIN_2v1482640 [Rhizophagus irregularis DAOM 181602=DAOM 197198]